MTRLVYWYGVTPKDRGKAFSFVRATKLVDFEEGRAKGYCKIPAKIQTKMKNKQKMTKAEEQLKRGLRQILKDMKLDKVDRAAWMLKFKEDHELAKKSVEPEALVDKEEDGEIKNKSGGPNKRESALMTDTSMDKLTRRKPGRPKKVNSVLPKPVPRKKLECEKAKSAVTEAAEIAATRAKTPATKTWLVIKGDQEPEMGADDDEDDSNSYYDAKTPKKRKAAISRKKPAKKAKNDLTRSSKSIQQRTQAPKYKEQNAGEKESSHNEYEKMVSEEEAKLEAHEPNPQIARRQSEQLPQDMTPNEHGIDKNKSPDNEEVLGALIYKNWDKSPAAEPWEMASLPSPPPRDKAIPPAQEKDSLCFVNSTSNWARLTDHLQCNHFCVDQNDQLSLAKFSFCSLTKKPNAPAINNNGTADHIRSNQDVNENCVEKNTYSQEEPKKASRPNRTCARSTDHIQSVHFDFQKHR